MVCSKVLLNDNGCRSHFQEPSSAIPSSNAPLQNQDLASQNPISFLFEKQVLSVFQEHFGPAELVVGFAQNNLTDFGRPGSALFLKIKNKLLSNVEKGSFINYVKQLVGGRGGEEGCIARGGVINDLN